jgi:hypothetical protein
MSKHVLDQYYIRHRGRDYRLGDLTSAQWAQIKEQMRADLVAAKGEAYMAALDARIAEIVATHPLFRGEHQE